MSSFGGRQSGAMQQQTFSFPMLSASEILGTWEDVPLQAKDLEKPTAASVRAVYETLCEQCIGPVVREEMNNPDEDALGQIEFPELHEESLPQLTFFRYVQRLLAAAGVHDFTMADVLKPDAKRFKRNLCAIINFQKFRLERLEAFEKLHMQFGELCEEKAAVDEQCAAVEDKIRAIQAQREAEMPQAERLRGECKELEAELKQSNKEHAALQHELKQLKNKSTELKDYLATLRFQKLNMSQECERMEKNIVRSPERLKTELSEQQRLLESAREENSRLAQQRDGLAKRDNALERAADETGQLLATIRQAEQSMNDCKQAARDFRKMTSSVKDHGNAMRQLRTQKAEVERQIEIVHDRSSRLQKTKSLKLAAAAHALKEASQELEALRGSNSDLREETAANQELAAKLTAKLAAAKEAHAASLAKRQEAFARVERIIDASAAAIDPAA